jgi:diguanylate cyclase (GGDEF)-like protein
MGISADILEQVISASAEPLVIVRVDQPNWPVVFSNPAFDAIGGEDTVDKPFADVIEQLAGREAALDVSEAVRAREQSSFPLELGSREFLLALLPLGDGNDDVAYYAAFWRGGAGVAGSDMHHALLKAKRRIRDLSRDDPVTGLLNAKAFRDVLDHDLAVAAREQSSLALVLFTLDEFDAYIDVFGKHASDSCLRRVGQAIRRCLRRASDVVGRLEGARLVALSHASDEAGVREFAEQISTAVRELGLHHPRSSRSRFVTVSFEVAMSDGGRDRQTAEALLDALLSGADE